MESRIIQFPGIVWHPGKVATEVCRTLSAFAWCIGCPLTLDVVDIMEQWIIATTPTNRLGRHPVFLIGLGVVVYDNGVHVDVTDNGNIPSLTFMGFSGCQHLVEHTPGWKFVSIDDQCFALILDCAPALIHSLNGEILQPVPKPVLFH
ncbi:MAG: hypothetical protein V1685_06930 [Parcubacteria group bacterium]